MKNINKIQTSLNKLIAQKANKIYFLNVQQQLRKNKKKNLFNKSFPSQCLQNFNKLFYRNESEQFTLKQLISSKYSFTEIEILYFLNCLLSQLNYCYHSCLCHRNVKPSNIYLSTLQSTWILGNFDYSLYFPQKSSFITESYVGTLTYMSPELYTNYIICEKIKKNNRISYDPFVADLFALAVIVVEMSGVNKEQLMGLKNQKQQNQIIEQIGKHYPRVKIIVKKMIEVNPRKRLKYEQVLQEIKQFKLDLSQQKDLPKMFQQNYIFLTNQQQNNPKDSQTLSFRHYFSSKAYNYLNQFASAIESINIAIQVNENQLKSNPDPSLTCKILKYKFTLCYYYLYSGDITEAKHLAEKLLYYRLDKYPEIDNNYSLAKIYFLLACIYYYDKDSLQAMKCIEYLNKVTTLLQLTDTSPKFVQTNYQFDQFLSNNYQTFHSTFPTSHHRQRSLNTQFLPLQLFNTFHSFENLAKPRNTPSQNKMQKLQMYTLYVLSQVEEFNEERIQQIYFTVNQVIQTEANYIVNAIRILSSVAQIWEDKLYYKQTAKCYQQILDIIKAEKQNYYTDLQASAMWSLGNLYIKLAQYGLAQKYLEESLQIRQELYGNNHPEVADTYFSFGQLYQKQKNYQKSQKCFQQAVSIRENIFVESNNIQFWLAKLKLAEVLKENGELEKALSVYQEALSVFFQNYYESNLTEISQILENIGNIYSQQCLYNDALTYYWQCLEIKKKLYSTNETIQIAITYSNIGHAYSNLQAHESSIKYLEKALLLKYHNQEQNMKGIQLLLKNLIKESQKLNDFDHVIKFYKQLLSLYKLKYGQSNRIIADTMIDLGVICENFSQHTLQFDYCNQALSIYKKFYPNETIIIKNLLEKLIKISELNNYYQQKIKEYSVQLLELTNKSLQNDKNV